MSKFTQDNLINLPPKYTPGSDLISKLVLNDDEVMKMLITLLVDDAAANEYATGPTEWANCKKSDVVYCPASRKNMKLPPILIEVQYSADINFFQRLIEYSLSARKYYGTLPIVLTIVVHSTSQQLTDHAYNCQELLYVKNLPCIGWAKACYLMKKETIAAHLQDIPLNPLVAITRFLVEGECALINIDCRNDAIIKKLYRIADNIPKSEVEEEEENHEYEKLYFWALNGLNKTKEILLENQDEERKNKRAIECLDDHISSIEDLEKNRHADKPKETRTISPCGALLCL